MNEITHFAKNFGLDVTIPDTELLQIKKHFFRTKKKKLTQSFDVLYTGEFLGTLHGNAFRPSLFFVDHYLKSSPQSVQLDKKAAWLFLCGRDVFSASIPKTAQLKPGHIIVRDNFGDIIGYGVVPAGFNRTKQNAVAVKNILDKGDYLRREKSR